MISIKHGVVNCFQKLLSSWHDTTAAVIYDPPVWLWIAFKNYYLRDTTQLFSLGAVEKFSCELLSKIIIFVTRHNTRRQVPSIPAVVNCFQKLLSSWHDTTPGWSVAVHAELWIAFKNYYLRDTTQHYNNFRWCSWCCELLSKIIIFVTRHNSANISPHVWSVVNCFQKLLSSWHDTTSIEFFG